MISLIGIGNASSAIVQKFSEISQYDIYTLNSKVEKNTKNALKLEAYNRPEEYEKNLPDVRKFLKNAKGRVQVFVMGASMSSIYSLGILQQIQHKEIDVFYIKPDTDLLTGVPRLVENTVFGVLQEYARSGLFRTFTILSNENIERVVQKISLKKLLRNLERYNLFVCALYELF